MPGQHGHAGVVVQGQAGAALQAKDAHAEIGILVHMQILNDMPLPPALQV